MPKITKGDGPSIAGVTPPVPTEDEYVAAMGRHGTDKWTDEDADVQVRWDAERARLLAAVDPHAPVPLLFDLPPVPAPVAVEVDEDSLPPLREAAPVEVEEQPVRTPVRSTKSASHRSNK